MSDSGTRVRYPRFKKGDRVALTHYAIKRNIRSRGSKYGTVTSDPRRRMSVNVRLDGRKSSGSFWSGFWRHQTAAEVVTRYLQTRGEE